MKKEQSKLVLIPSNAEVASNSFIKGDVILGAFTRTRKGSVINSLNNTIIIGSYVSINEEAKITSFGDEGYTFICNNVNIGKGAHVCNSTLEENVQIKGKAYVMDGCYVARGASIGERTIITPHSRVIEGQNCEPNSVYSGNPAVKVGNVDVNVQKTKEDLKNSNFSKVT